MERPEEAKVPTLSPQQRMKIEELVRVSPSEIKSRQRRDALMTSTVLDQYARPTPPDQPQLLHPPN